MNIKELINNIPSKPLTSIEANNLAKSSGDAIKFINSNPSLYEKRKFPTTSGSNGFTIGVAVLLEGIDDNKFERISFILPDDTYRTGYNIAKEFKSFIREKRPLVSLTQYPILKLGSSGVNVAKWQSIIGLPINKIDGIFNAQTEQNTRNWQISHNLPSTGIVDDKTWLTAISTQFPIDKNIQNIPIEEPTGMIMDTSEDDKKRFYLIVGISGISALGIITYLLLKK